MSMNFIRKLPIPQDIKNQYPVSKELSEIKNERDEEIKNVLSGKEDKFLLLVGPCSADNKESVLKYVSLLKPVAEKVKDKIIIIPRVYTNKPRTSGVGYMGMLHQPDCNSKPDLLKGLIAVRDLHLTILKDFNLTCADELLYPDNYRYLSDLLSYVTVGARSVENQYHRLVASGLDIPVGMKNPIYGNVEGMFNAVKSSRESHAFLYRGWEVLTNGNNLVHGVLRGYKQGGEDIPNYRYQDLLAVIQKQKQENTVFPLLIDVNHSNSGKVYYKQSEIALDVLASRNKNADIKNTVKGLMIESYLLDGSQNLNGKKQGVSVTDPCLGWSSTEKLIYDIREKL